MIATLNGDARVQREALARSSMIDPPELPLIAINQFSLSGKQFGAVLAVVVALLSAGALGAVFFWPAKQVKQTELSALTAITTTLNANVESMKQDSQAIARSMVDLSVVVNKIAVVVGDLQSELIAARELQASASVEQAPRPKRRDKVAQQPQSPARATP